MQTKLIQRQYTCIVYIKLNNYVINIHLNKHKWNEIVIKFDKLYDKRYESSIAIQRSQKYLEENNKKNKLEYNLTH